MAALIETKIILFPKMVGKVDNSDKNCPLRDSTACPMSKYKAAYERIIDTCVEVDI